MREHRKRQWIEDELRSRKPTAPGQIVVRRDGASRYRVGLLFDDEGHVTELPIAQISRDGFSWLLEWTSGNGIWRRLDDKTRDLEMVLVDLLRDDYGCFFG